MTAEVLINPLPEMSSVGASAAARERPKTRRRGRKGEFWNWISWAILPATLLLVWYLTTSAFGVFSENQLPAPQQVVRAAAELVSTGAFFEHLRISLLRVGMGFGVGTTLGLLVGVVVGLSRQMERLLDSTLQAIRNVPSLAWVPFLLLWMGIDEVPKITLIAIGTFFPVYINVVAGIRQVDRKLLEVGYIFGLTQWQLVRRIFVPASLPFVVTGLRIGAGQAWLFLTAAELIASTRGFGFMLIDGQNSLRPDIMLVAILSLALLGKLTDSVLRFAERRLVHWSDCFKGNG